MSLTLPGHYDGAVASAGWSGGRRVLTWTMDGPGMLHRCRFGRVWVEVCEREPWRGEPLAVWASRTMPDGSGWARHPLTDAALAAVHAELVPLVARAGFDRLWRATWEPGAVHGGSVQAAEDYLAWWRDREVLTDMWEAGVLDVVPVEREEHWMGARGPQVRVWHGPGVSADTRETSARLLADGAQVGWVTTRGELVPVSPGR